MAYVDEADLAGTAAGQGAEMVGFKPVGTGAQDDTVKGQLDKAGRFYPEDFGAVGDGTVGGGGADDAAAINACDLAAAAAGGTVVFRNSYRVGTYPDTEGQILISANWHFEGGRIIRDWTAELGAGERHLSATLKGRTNDDFGNFYGDAGNYQPTGKVNNIAITGQGYIGMSNAARAYYDADGGATSHAATIYFLGDNFRLENGVFIELGGYDWAVVYGGDNARISPWIGPHSLTSGPNITEDGFHVILGDNGIIFDGNVESGDDCYPFASNLNLPIRNWIVRDCIGFSHLAFICKVYQARENSTAGKDPIDQPIEDQRMGSQHASPQLTNRDYSRRCSRQYRSHRNVCPLATFAQDKTPPRGDTHQAPVRSPPLEPCRDATHG